MRSDELEDMSHRNIVPARRHAGMNRKPLHRLPDVNAMAEFRSIFSCGALQIE